MITEQQFINAIDEIGMAYENLKDLIHSEVDCNKMEPFLKELAVLRDTACIALRASHVTKNFNDN